MSKYQKSKMPMKASSIPKKDRLHYWAGEKPEIRKKANIALNNTEKFISQSDPNKIYTDGKNQGLEEIKGILNDKDYSIEQALLNIREIEKSQSEMYNAISSSIRRDYLMKEPPQQVPQNLRDRRDLNFGIHMAYHYFLEWYYKKDEEGRWL